MVISKKSPNDSPRETLSQTDSVNQFLHHCWQLFCLGRHATTVFHKTTDDRFSSIGSETPLRSLSFISSAIYFRVEIVAHMGISRRFLNNCQIESAGRFLHHSWWLFCLVDSKLLVTAKLSRHHLFSCRDYGALCWTWCWAISRKIW